MKLLIVMTAAALGGCADDDPTAIAPTILAQPTDVRVAADATASFSVEAVGSFPLTYAWAISRDGGVTFALAPTNEPTLVLPHVAAADDGLQVRVVVRNRAGAADSTIAHLQLAAPTTTTWQVGVVAGAEYADWGKLAVVDAHTAWIGASSPVNTIGRTVDGVHWAAVTPPPVPQYQLDGLAASDGSTAWVTSTGGLIAKTTDGGATWSVQPSGTTVTLFAITAVDAAVAWAVGDAGTILQTTDGGATWRAQTSGTAVALLDVVARDASEAWAVGRAGTVLHTRDGGAHWTAGASGTTLDLVTIARGDAQHLWVRGGTLIQTADGGDTWTPASIEPIGALTWGSVAAGDARTAWVVGVNGTIERTTDGGATWTADAIATTETLGVVAATSATTAWVGGAHGVIGWIP